MNNFTEKHNQLNVLNWDTTLPKQFSVCYLVIKFSNINLRYWWK